MNALRELNDAMLHRFTQIDYDREMALIAVVCENALETEIGVTRYIGVPEEKVASLRWPSPMPGNIAVSVRFFFAT